MIIKKISKISLINSSNIISLPDLSNFLFLESIVISNSPLIENWVNILQVGNLKFISLSFCNLTGKIVDFSNLEKIETISLNNNLISSTDLLVFKHLNDKIFNIDLSNNSIINANVLFDLNENSKINLSKNINLSLESKDKLTSKFKNNVIF